MAHAQLCCSVCGVLACGKRLSPKEAVSDYRPKRAVCLVEFSPVQLFPSPWGRLYTWWYTNNSNRITTYVLVFVGAGFCVVGMGKDNMSPISHTITLPLCMSPVLDNGFLQFSDNHCILFSPPTPPTWGSLYWRIDFSISPTTPVFISPISPTNAPYMRPYTENRFFLFSPPPSVFISPILLQETLPVLDNEKLRSAEEEYFQFDVTISVVV